MLTLANIMTTDVATVAPETSLRDAAALLVSRHVSGAPVVSGGRVVGVITSSDLLDFAAAGPGVPRAGEPAWGEWGETPAGEGTAGAAASTEWDEMGDHSVEEVMTRDIWSLPPSASALEAAEMMWRRSMHRVLVMEGDALRGIVTTTDIARAAAGHRLGARTFVFNHDREFDGRGWP